MNKFEEMKSAPFWWEEAPRPEGDDSPPPGEADVVVVGSGYTGLHAALQTSRDGLSTVVLDAGELGGGCSSRNGGQVSTSVKGSFTELAAKYGEQQAQALQQEGVNALEYLDTFIRQESIDCDWVRCGHFSGAHNTAAYERKARELRALPAALGIEWQMVPRAEQRREIGSDLYHGGVIFPSHGALHPGKYHQELLSRVQSAGAMTIGHCAVQRIEKRDTGFDVHTSRGVIRAGKVALATNGYTDAAAPWLRRRIIPIGSYIIATQPLSETLAREISPRGRTMTDTRRLVFYYRLCPRGQRMLFGGRVALSETDDRVSAPRLHAAMSEIFPQLSSAQISHSWLGFVGYTFDALPHVGEHDGMFYSMGYCGSGVSLASYCGSILGRQMCGEAYRSPFMDTEFKTRPLYTGNPWFLKPSIAYYRVRDRINW